MAELKEFDDLPSSIGNGAGISQTFDDLRAQGEEYVRQSPTNAVLAAVGAGFLLRLLPIGALVGLLVRLALFAVRPALFLYGAITLYKNFAEREE